MRQAANVRRGREDAVIQDRSNGDWCFGYTSEPIPGSEASRGTRVPRIRHLADDTQAGWVRRVCDWFAVDGWTLAAIARELTRLNAPRDRPVTRPGWGAPAVRRLLNRKYVGERAWGKRQLRRNPPTGRTWQELRAADDSGLLVRLRSELRLVTDDLFDRAAGRLAGQTETAKQRRKPGG